MMNKKIMRIIFSGLVAVFISGTILMPTVATVFAAEQTANQEQTPPPPQENAPKDSGNEHSGHHM